MNFNVSSKPQSNNNEVGQEMKKNIYEGRYSVVSSFSTAKPTKDFFISYNKNDIDWAKWIAWILEEQGYSVVIDAWDFLPGSNFALEMHKAAAGTRKTIIVLSEDFLSAKYTQPEWAAAFASDPQGQQRTLIPIRVKECKPTGLLGPFIYIDIIGLPEQEAREKILKGVASERAKPDQAPAFPRK